jgi:hypothetical protein
MSSSRELVCCDLLCVCFCVRITCCMVNVCIFTSFITSFIAFGIDPLTIDSFLIIALV